MSSREPTTLTACMCMYVVCACTYAHACTYTHAHIHLGGVSSRHRKPQPHPTVPQLLHIWHMCHIHSSQHASMHAGIRIMCRIYACRSCAYAYHVSMHAGTMYLWMHMIWTCIHIMCRRWAGGHCRRWHPSRLCPLQARRRHAQAAVELSCR